MWNPALCPNTCPEATDKSTVDVKDVSVIKVVGAQYRNATVSGVFHVAQDVTLPMQSSGWYPVEVYCRWFDHRIKTRGIELTIDASTSEFIPNYTGAVISNISK